MLALSLACYIGINKKYKVIWLSVLLIVLAAIFESLVIKGVI